MRCHLSDHGDEMSPSAYNIWTSGNLQTPNILKSILNPNVSATNSITDELSNLSTVDPVSPSQKRKILDCEKEDFEERFHKIQRKKQLQKVAARANLVIDDDEASDEEDKIYEQMDWIEKENAVSLWSCDSSSEEEDSSFDEKTNGPVPFLSRSKWKDERRRLLRISMAKIRGVEDPEAYLRRSVLINNTVKRLQTDVPVDYRCHTSASTSFLQGNETYQNDNVSSWDVTKQTQLNTFEYQYVSSASNDEHFCNYPNPENCENMPCSSNFHLACASVSSDKVLHTLEHEGSHADSFCDKSPADEQRLNDVTSSSVSKQTSPLHMFSSQPCGLQYRNPVHSEDSREEYRESSHSGSSLLDSVVYHSLVTSLET
ncbi:SERTA domain-containing protein [Trichonephila clavata]|uniref:SERTA domain-containing protein n=1 Tax=Trichonephila clavata TaxID=2740835 RepID=A0A8X6K3L5_TRICU|nr:SERTA domain-containing protein [Trichonephila clavata]